MKPKMLAWLVASLLVGTYALADTTVWEIEGELRQRLSVQPELDPGIVAGVGLSGNCEWLRCGPQLSAGGGSLQRCELDCVLQPRVAGKNHPSTRARVVGRGRTPFIAGRDAQLRFVALLYALLYAKALDGSREQNLDQTRRLLGTLDEFASPQGEVARTLSSSGRLLESLQ